MPSHPPSLTPTSRARRARGLTLIELLIFIGIVSIALVALVRVFVQATLASGDPLVQRQALAIAESVLEEVLSKPFTFCDSEDARVETATSPAGCAGPAEAAGPEAGETRLALPSFDHVNDYHGFSMAGLTDLAGGTLPALAAYRTTVSVSAATLGSLAAASGDALRIDVSVTGPGGLVLSLVGYRSRHAPHASL